MAHANLERNFPFGWFCLPFAQTVGQPQVTQDRTVSLGNLWTNRFPSVNGRQPGAPCEIIGD